ncbi:hypothetical protein FACS1894177_07770 [Bacteroidia bacterium]|nr:hypothetical protein FACS1894177_07770 [Bacteroidia bacterium]
MEKTFVLHDESVNTYGFRMLTSGGDLSEFRRNPVMLLNHDDWILPIGRWEDIRIEDGKILADPVFDMKDERGRQVADKVKDNFIRMASIGSWPPEEFSDDPSMKYPGQTGPTITRWKVREASIVTIGANHNAMAFYDKNGKPIDLNDKSQIVNLFDKNLTIKNNVEMKILTGILNLADTVSENDIATAVRKIISDKDRLTAENVTLKDRIDKVNSDAKTAQKQQAISLVDAAVKDGRIDARAKDSYLKLFDSDFDSAKTALDAIPVRQSVSRQIQTSASAGTVELKDLQDKTWDELDKTDKLTLLRDNYPELYAEKFKQRFGCEPK